MYLTSVYFNNSIYDYLVSLLLFVGILLIIKIFKSIVLARLKNVAAKTTNDLDDNLINALQKISRFFYFGLALYFSSFYLNLVPVLDKAIYYLFIISLTWQAIITLTSLLDFFLKKIIKKQNGFEGSFDGRLLLFSKIIKAIIWIIGGLLILSNLGYDISTLIASLGIGGIAIALAMQNILSDLFASLAIYLDQPFKVGDFIVLGDKMGTVKKIGIKTTRVTSLQGEELIFSNKELTTAQIQNFKKMKERRVSFMFGITYDTKSEKLKKIGKLVELAINSVGKCKFDRANWKDFGDFSLNYEVVYFISSSDYNEYMTAQEEINLAIKESFEKEKIEFAYPTQTILLNK